MNFKDMYETYEEWLDVFADECQNLGWYGPIMEVAFEGDYEAEKCPYETAREFVAEMKRN